MKILFTGGGSGGHFYPIIAIATEVTKVAQEKKLLKMKMYFAAPEPYDENVLFENGIEYRKVYAGKVRRYFSFMNFFDIFKTGIGILKSMWLVYSIFPDVVFGKGGYGSFPVLVAARILGIPIIIHESDSAPGRVNAWAGKFAERIAVSYASAAKYFPEDKTALTGNPTRQELLTPQKKGASEFLHLESGLPTILILGGSQ